MKRLVLLLVLLVFALAAMTAVADEPQQPENPPAWWNPDAPYWGWLMTDDPEHLKGDSNFPGFGTALDGTLDENGVNWEFKLFNQISFDHLKRFYLRVEGTGATSKPRDHSVGFDYFPEQEPPHVKSSCSWSATKDPDSSKWTLIVDGTVNPQPSAVLFKWSVWGSDPVITNWEVYENCIVPEPGSLLMLGGGLMGLAGMIKRRRR